MDTHSAISMAVNRDGKGGRRYQCASFDFAYRREIISARLYYAAVLRHHRHLPRPLDGQACTHEALRRIAFKKK